jgi:hypothetical protein
MEQGWFISPWEDMTCVGQSLVYNSNNNDFALKK